MKREWFGSLDAGIWHSGGLLSWQTGVQFTLDVFLAVALGELMGGGRSCSATQPQICLARIFDGVAMGRSGAKGVFSVFYENITVA